MFCSFFVMLFRFWCLLHVRLNAHQHSSVWRAAGRAMEDRVVGQVELDETLVSCWGVKICVVLIKLGLRCKDFKVYTISY